MRTINYTILPEHMQETARLYVEEGVPPGSFVEAVLSNDFKESFGRADDVNRHFMFEWAKWIYNECPAGAQGSQQRVHDWTKRGGLKGMEATRSAE